MGGEIFKMAAQVLLETLRFGTRLGVPVGVVYVTTFEGLWGSQEEAISFYDKVKAKKTDAGLDLPQAYGDKISAAVEKVALFSNPSHLTVAERWYNAVTGTVNFLDTAPEKISNFLNIDKILGSE